MLGAHNVENSEETNSILMGVDKIVVNPEYDFVSKGNDLALLQLPRPVEFAANPTIRPVCLPANSSQDYSGRTATVAGWGRQTFGGQASPVLKVNFFFNQIKSRGFNIVNVDFHQPPSLQKSYMQE